MAGSFRVYRSAWSWVGLVGLAQVPEGVDLSVHSLHRVRPTGSILAMAAVPRVRPRARMEDMVDVASHPPRRKVRTVEEGETAPSFHWTSMVALVALVIFWVSLGPAAALVAMGWPLGYGLAGLAASSLVVAYFMGAS